MLCYGYLYFVVVVFVVVVLRKLMIKRDINKNTRY